MPYGAPPYFRLAGTQAHGTGDVTVSWPAHATGDVALLVIETQENTGTAVTLGTPSGFVEVTNSPVLNSQGGSSTKLSVFWCRATSGAMADVVITDPGDHAIAQILTFRGCVSFGTPYNVTATSTSGTSTTAQSVAGATTSLDLTLAVEIITCHFDGGAVAFASGWTNTDLLNIAEITDIRTDDGGGGGVAAAAGIKEVAGAYGTTSVTFTSAGFSAGMTIALLSDPPNTNGDASRITLDTVTLVATGTYENRGSLAATLAGDSLTGISFPASDTTAPVVSNFSPALGGVVLPGTTISFDVTDDHTLRLVGVDAYFADGTYEVVHDGFNFSANYLGSTRTAISGGYSFAILRVGGWPSLPALRFPVVDGSGNIAVVS